MPVILHEWEIYWEKTFREEKEKTEQLEEQKQKSWRKFQVFMACYDDTANIINLAYDIEYEVLFPLSVITMLEIFNAESCYSEYCEYEFTEEKDWEMISIGEGEEEEDEFDDDSQFIYIREHEYLG